MEILKLERLQEGRKKSGLTQKQASVSLGLSSNMVAKYETGQARPSLEILEKIAALYKVSIGWLFEEGNGRSKEEIEFYENHDKFHHALDYIFNQGSTSQRREAMGTILDLERELREIKGESE